MRPRRIAGRARRYGQPGRGVGDAQRGSAGAPLLRPITSEREVVYITLAGAGRSGGSIHTPIVDYQCRTELFYYPTRPIAGFVERI